MNRVNIVSHCAVGKPNDIMPCKQQVRTGALLWGAHAHGTHGWYQCNQITLLAFEHHRVRHAAEKPFHAFRTIIRDKHSSMVTTPQPHTPITVSACLETYLKSRELNQVDATCPIVGSSTIRSSTIRSSRDAVTPRKDKAKVVKTDGKVRNVTKNTVLFSVQQV